jgi:hypothetical protein
LSRAEAGYVEGTKGLERYLSRRRDKLMVATSKIILPYEPGYVANKEADKQRKETKKRLRQREREFAERQQPPSFVPERGAVLRRALS